MASYTVGQIRRAYIVEEVNYGVTPTTALSYTGEIARLAQECNYNPEVLYLMGSRAFQASYRGPYDAGFTYKAWLREDGGGYDWMDFWSKMSLGAETVVADTVPSFSMLTGKTVGATNHYNLWNGCKVNDFKLSCDKPGTALEFEIGALAQLCEYSSTRSFTGLQSVAVNASDPTIPTTAIITWRGNLALNIGGGAVTIYPTKFELSVKNLLKREYGTRVGNDSVKYPVALHLQEDKREIEVDLSLPYGSETYTEAKRAGTAITSLTIPVGSHTITLGGGIFAANDFPELSQAPAEESLKMLFSTITVA